MTEHTVTVDDDRGAQSGGPPPPPPPRPWYRTPVARDTANRRLGGVVSGLCRAYGFDVRTTRLALVIATLVVPILVAVYVLAWIVLPKGADRAVPLSDVVTDRRRLPLVIVLAVVLVAAGVSSFGSWWLFGGIPWGLGLIAIGVLLWVAAGSRADRRGPPGSEHGPATGGTLRHPAAEWAPPVAPVSSTPVDTHGPARRRWPIGLWSMVGALAVVGALAAGDGLDWWDVSRLAGLLTFLAILATGAGLSALVNQSWAPVPALVLLAGSVSVLATTQPDLDGGIGHRTVRPLTIESAAGRHEMAVGQLVLDLTAVPASVERPLVVEASLGVGQLRVLVPTGARLDLDLDIGAGHAVIDGDEIASGIRHGEQRSDEPDGPATGIVHLRLEVGMGEISIERVRGG